MDESHVETATETRRAADGRVPGRRGQATRQRLLEETLAALVGVPYRDLRVVDITRRAGTSPATFYQYFPGVEAAVLDLAETMVEAGRAHLAALVIDPDWESPVAARGLADGFLSFFDEHQPLLRVVELATAEGDERFYQLRIRLLNGVFSAIESLVDDARTNDRLPESADPAAVAGVLTTMLARVSGQQPGYQAWGIEREALASTMAEMIAWSIRHPESAFSD